jgi:hypothetical protein
VIKPHNSSRRLPLATSPLTDIPLASPIAAAIITLGVVIGFYFLRFDGNITGFFRIGSVLPISPYLDPTQTLIHPGELGYDGQQFLSLALDPFLQNPGTIAALDSPLYRYRRILYPLVGYVLGFGDRVLIPYVLVAINYLCVVALVWTAGWGLQQTNDLNETDELDEPDAPGYPAEEQSKPVINWQSLLVLCVPGLWMTLVFSTADLLSSTLLMVAICGYRYGRSRLTGGAIAAACLTRETMLLGWLALVICSLSDRNWKQLRSLMLSAIPALAWNVYVAQKLGHQGTAGVNSNFGLPWAGLVHKFSVLLQAGFTGKNLFEAYAFILLLTVFGVAIALSRFTPSKNRVIWLCACLYAALLACSNDAILWYFMGYSRVYMDAFFLLLLVLNCRNPLFKILPLLAGAIPSLAFLLLSS